MIESWRQHETALIVGKCHDAPRGTGRIPPIGWGPYRRRHSHSSWVEPTIRGLKGSGRHIPGEMLDGVSRGLSQVRKKLDVN